MYGRFAEQRRADGVFVRAGAYGIESECREYIPCRSLSVVLVSAVTVGFRGIESVHHLADPILRLVGLSDVVVKVDHVLCGLVAVGVVAHVGYLHLRNLVDADSVVAVIVDRRHDEHRIEHFSEFGFAAHQRCKALRIVEHRPCVVPCIALRICVAPLVGAERCLKRPVFVAATHQTGFGIEEVFVVLRGFFQPLRIFGPAQFLRHLCDAPVVVGVFQRPGGTLVDTHVVGHIAQRVVILVPEASRGAYRRMNLASSCEHRLVERGDVLLWGDALEDGVRHDRGRVVAHHAAAVSRRSPFGQEAALTVGVGQSGLNLGVDRRIDEVQQRKQAPERIPESRVGVHIARQHLAVVGTVMHGVAVFVQFVEFAGEERRAVEA